ncbi:MAG: CerR family C-terminal domain-containing protein [Planctomycetota bacterium]
MANDDTRTRILNAAGPIFAEKGYEAATVREICQEAGVNLASVNYYFRGKEQLYIEAVMLEHPAKFGPEAKLDWPVGTPAAAKLKDFIHALLTHLLGRKTSPWQERLIVREIMDPSPVCRELLREHFRAAFDRLQGILAEILPADTPSYKRHQIGLSIIGQCVYYRSAQKIVPLIVGEEEIKSHYGIEQLAEHISEVSLAALGLGPSLACPRHGESSPSSVSTTAAKHSAVTADPTGEGKR